MLRRRRSAGAGARAHLRHRRPHRADRPPGPPAARRAGRGDAAGDRGEHRRRTGSASSPIGSGDQGIVHVIGPELGLTQPGMTIACGDSHTSTHGAFGAIAFGIGTSQVRDVLASQCLALARPKVRRIRVSRDAAASGVYAKDVILAHHPQARREGRRRLRLRVRGRRDRAHLDGGAHDRLQHVDRGRRAGRLREPGPDHLRLPARPPLRAAGGRLRARRRRGGAAWPATPTRTSTTRSRSRARTSRRP